MQTLGLFGSYGGVYVPESLIPALEELESAFLKFSQDDAFLAEFHAQLRNFAGRPTPLFHAKNLSKQWAKAGQGAQIWFKREDLLHGGAHKTNNAIGQALLAKAMGKHRIIAETGAGQHGVATAMAGALLGLETIVYMGEVDTERQLQNVNRMKLLGTTVVPVKSGSRTLKDAINEALRDWITNVRSTHYLLGTVAGPHPFPAMVKFFHKVMGDEAKIQFADACNGQLPDVVIACVGGGSNAIGIFNAFLEDKEVRLIGVEPAGRGLDTQEHGAVLALGTPGTLHGMKSLLLQNVDGQIHETHSISAGLDYPSVGPEHAYLKEIGRVQYETATDAEAMAAFHQCSQNEGILPALETAHALAYAEKLAPRMRNDQHILINLSGRGDKDLQTVLDWSPPFQQ